MSDREQGNKARYCIRHDFRDRLFYRSIGKSKNMRIEKNEN